MARGMSTVGGTREEALESVLREHPDLKIVGCERIDLSDIPMHQPPPKDHWAIAFEDPNPGEFVQDNDPIGKVTNEVRALYASMARDPQRLSSGLTEGPFSCPACSSEVNFHLPPGWVQQRMPLGAKVYTRCPDCDAKLFRRRGDARDNWHIEPAAEPEESPKEPRAPGEGLERRRACIFCGAEDQKISKEHLWSKWIREHVEGSTGGTSSRILGTGTGRVTKRDDWPSPGFDREVSGPCKPCNEGWMEELEREAAPCLTPMLLNEERVFRQEEQRTLARWATMKMLVAQESHGEMRRVIPLDRYRLFYANRSLPIGAQVWIGRYSGAGSWPTNYQYRELFMTIQGQDEPSLPNAYIVGFTIGYLAFVYWGHEITYGPVADIQEVQPFLSQVWPATGVAKWPPPGLMEADGLDFVMKQLTGSGWL